VWEGGRRAGGRGPGGRRRRRARTARVVLFCPAAVARAISLVGAVQHAVAVLARLGLALEHVLGLDGRLEHVVLLHLRREHALVAVLARLDEVRPDAEERPRAAQLLLELAGLAVQLRRLPRREGLLLLVDAAADGSTKVRDPNKYYWALAEMIAAAGVLAVRFGEGQAGADERLATHYWGWYERAWDFAEAHFVDRELGGWYPMLNAANVRVDPHAAPDHTGPPVKCYPSKTDYHPLSACWEVLRALEAR